MTMNVVRTFRLPFLGISPVAGVAMMACSANKAPETPEVGIGPEGATTVDDFVLQLDGEPADADGDSVALGVSWSLDGSVRADLDGPRRVPSSLTAKGQTWEVSVTASDAMDVGDTRTASLTVANALPEAVLTDVSFAPDAASDLRVEADGADPDNDPVTLSYSWTVDGASTDVTGPVVPAEETAHRGPGPWMHDPPEPGQRPRMRDPPEPGQRPPMHDTPEPAEGPRGAGRAPAPWGLQR